ncbi:PP2C family protein-serine/threonine phosphatase [Streptomyces bauhiniae]|uniref:PP2C family protein-serine/threonine phosphatase n=1 Tax=Streptomyces bauhiniae TaxID=2340725 RepID=UPI0034520ACB
MSGKEAFVERLRRVSGKSPWVLAACVLAAGVLLTAFAPRPYVGLPLLAASPLMAGATLSFRTALGFACVAVAASVGLDLYRGRPASALWVDLAVIGLIGALALAVNALVESQRRDLAQARGIAEAVQRAVLPQPPVRVGPLAVASGYTAAQAEAQIGGDLFAVQDTPFGVRMIIGDVRGKGLQAVAAVSVAIGAFRQEAEYAPDLAALAERLDDALAREAGRGLSQDIATEDFATALLAEVSARGDVVRLLNRGHPAPYLVHEGQVTRLDASVPQMPLGMGLTGLAQGPDAAQADVLSLPVGALLLLVTDGVTEARNSEGLFYDPCSSCLAGRSFDSPESLVRALTTDVHRWTGGGQQDDMAILAVARRPVEDGPLPSRETR